MIAKPLYIPLFILLNSPTLFEGLCGLTRRGSDMAESEGFEPPVGSLLRLISSLKQNLFESMAYRKLGEYNSFLWVLCACVSELTTYCIFPRFKPTGARP